MEDIELIPYGCGRLRITHFPRIGEAAGTVVRTDSNMVRHNGVTYQEFDNVVVPGAANYTLRVSGQGAGTMVVNGKSTQAVDLSGGEAVFENLKDLLSGGFKFNAKQYNNIRFTGGVRVDGIEVTPVDRAITGIEITSTKRTGDSIKLITNLDPQETPYRVVYGTEPGVYTNTVRGFSSGTATLTGLDKNATYYVKLIAPIQGREVETDEMEFAPASSGGGLKPNPNVPAATYNGFNSLNYMEQDWQLFDPQNKVALQASADGSKTQIRFEKGPDVKAVLNLKDAGTWVDYVAEAELSVDLASNNNCGMILRGTGIGDGPDNYHGYFVGVGKLNVNKLPETGKPYSGPGLMIGYADGGWHDLKPMRLDIQPGQTYKLKVVVYGSQFAVYLDDELVTTFEDERFAKGTIGLRSYNEAFTAYNATVRPVEEADLEVFAEEESPSEWPDYVEANFSDDFTDTEASGAAWTKVGDTDRIQIADGKISLGASTNVKAAAGNDAWSDFAYQADVQLQGGSGNAGILFRTTREIPGADNYYGYYFGISGANFEIGKASNRWTALRNESYALDTGKPHTLKVLAYHNYLSFYIDGEHVATLMDDTHKTGKIGLRGYNRAYEADNVLVRPLTDAEIEEITAQSVEQKEITVDSSYNTLRISYPKTGNATSFKALVGTEPGVYTEEFVDFRFNGYKGSGPFTADKTAVSVAGDGPYYVKFMGLNGSSVVMASKEVEIAAGYRESTEADRGKLATMLAGAEALDASDFTETSLARLEQAIADAKGVADGASQMDVALATRMLYSAMNAPHSEDYRPATPPETKELSVNFTKNASLFVDGEEQTLSNLTGRYTAETEAEVSLRFVPAIAGRDFCTATCNGQDISDRIAFDKETGESSLSYEAKAGDKLQFAFALTSKQILRQVIATAEALAGGEEYAAAVPTVHKRFDQSLKTAKAVEADKKAAQEQINTAWSQLLDAIHLLRFEEGNTEDLEDLLDMIGLLDESRFTAASWEALLSAADEARALVDDPEPLKAEIEKAREALQKALEDLQELADKSFLESVVAAASKIDLTQYLEAGQAAFTEALTQAEALLEEEEAAQKKIDDAADALAKAMADLRKIPNKDALKARVENAGQVDTGKYTIASVNRFLLALQNANDVLNDPQADGQRVKAADAKLAQAQNALVEKADKKHSSGKSTAASNNAYGAEGIAVVGAANSAQAAARVTSDTTVDFVMKRGSAYCFKMTVVNSDAVPAFTVGDGSVLKTQFLAKTGSDYYYRVYAVGAPGQSTGVYTTLPGQNAVKHCTVTAN